MRTSSATARSPAAPEPGASARGRRRSAARPGFTFIDLMMTIAVMGLLAAMVAPALSPEEPLRLVNASTMLASDLEFAQSATLAAPGDVTIVKFDPAAPRYWLALASAPDTPITRPYSTNPYEVAFGAGVGEHLTGVAITLTNAPGNTITFDAFGRLTQTTNAGVKLSNTSGQMTVSVTASTGSVNVGP